MEKNQCQLEVTSENYKEVVKSLKDEIKCLKGKLETQINLAKNKGKEQELIPTKQVKVDFILPLQETEVINTPARSSSSESNKSETLVETNKTEKVESIQASDLSDIEAIDDAIESNESIIVIKSENADEFFPANSETQISEEENVAQETTIENTEEVKMNHYLQELLEEKMKIRDELLSSGEKTRDYKTCNLSKINSTHFVDNISLSILSKFEENYDIKRNLHELKDIKFKNNETVRISGNNSFLD